MSENSYFLSGAVHHQTVSSHIRHFVPVRFFSVMHSKKLALLSCNEQTKSGIPAKKDVFQTVTQWEVRVKG